MDPADAEMIKQADDIAGNGAGIVAGRGPRRFAEAAEIGRDDAIAPGEIRDDATPRVPALRPAVEEDDRLAIGRSRLDPVQRDLANRRALVTERWVAGHDSRPA
jgi:hypothetical protein